MPLTHPTRPCKTCPWRKDSKPDALGGGPPSMFLGQALANFYLPCHSLYTKGVSAKDQDASVCGQCAGAAIFRANIGVPPAPGVHSLPKDDRVFRTAVHFFAHHSRITYEEARVTATPEALRAWAYRELTSAQVRLQVVPRA